MCGVAWSCTDARELYGLYRYVTPVPPYILDFTTDTLCSNSRKAVNKPLRASIEFIMHIIVIIKVYKGDIVNVVDS